MKKLIIVLFAIGIVSGVVACSGKTKVTYVTNYEEWKLTPTVVSKGQEVIEPVGQLWDGHLLQGWYEEQGFSTLISWPYSPTKSITIYAKWIDALVVTYVTNNESWTLPNSSILANGSLEQPSTPTWEGHGLVGWYLTSTFNQIVTWPYVVTSNITLYAKWITGTADQAKVQADAEALTSLDLVNFQLPTKGSIYDSIITWKSASNYITDGGIVLPIPGKFALPSPIKLTATFKLGTATLTKDFTYSDFSYGKDVILSPLENRTLEFKNLTPEYEVEDGFLDVFYEAGGSVPYVKVQEFIKLIKGFIDPIYFDENESKKLRFTEEDTWLEIYYEYYDEDEDYTYQLQCILDSSDNTIITNDPGFYYAYTASTETNYGRNIKYPDMENYFQEGHEVIYDLDDYAQDLAIVDNMLVAPLSLTNQLFAAAAYYNVYYNADGIFGIYALPADNSDEYKTIKNTSKANTPVPTDVAVSTFHMLAFYFDNFYGLRELRGISTYYDLLLASSSKLCLTNARTFDGNLSNFLYKTIDELHTSYGYSSFYNMKSYAGPILSISNLGPRGQAYYSSLDEVNVAIKDRWKITASGVYGADYRPDYWYLDEDKTAVMIAVDSFNTSDIKEDPTFLPDEINRALKITNSSSVFPAIVGGNKYYHYNQTDTFKKQITVLAKGISSSYVDTYKSNLVALGYSLVINPGSDYRNYGYYTKTLNGVDYMALVNYDETFHIFYAAISTKIPENYEDSWSITGRVKDTIDQDTAVYLELNFEKIFSETDVLEYVILDGSFNSGGNVGALYRLIGFITADPYFISRRAVDTDGYNTGWVQIINQPHYENLKWTYLSSGVSFSAGNTLADVMQENKLGKVIGQKTGGGACSVTPILLPNGSAFIFSSNSMSVRIIDEDEEEIFSGDERYDEDLGGQQFYPFYTYETIENGVDPDFLIEDMKNFYKADYLLDLLHSFNWEE